MTELVIAPALKPAEDGMKALVRMRFQLAENLDVARIADLLGQIGRIKNVFRLEVGVLLVTLQITEINAEPIVLQRGIQKTCMTRLVTRHVLHQLPDIRVADIALDLVVQHAT